MMTDFQEIRKTAWATVIEMFGLTDSGSSVVIPQPPTYTVATLPAAATYPRGLIYVSNETGGATLAFSDSTNWRRVQDRAVVS